jgi:DNA gyrase subunit B
VEGDSAGGTCKNARDRDFQELCLLRGKILNVWKAKSKERVSSSEEIMNVLSMVGFDPSKKDPMKHLQVGKVIFLADADHDGNHINMLLLGLFYKYVPEMFERGMVYVIRAPLYVTNHKGKFIFGYSKKEVYAQLPKDAKGKQLKRMKGLGEATAPELHEFAFNLEKRKLIQITPASGKTGYNRLKAVLGEDTQARAEILHADVGEAA